MFSVCRELYVIWKTFVRTSFLRKAELTNLNDSIEQRKSILHNGTI